MARNIVVTWLAIALLPVALSQGPGMSPANASLRKRAIIPWHCLVKSGGRVCSGTILNKSHVLVKSSCLPNTTNNATIQVYAGASDETNAKQIRNGTVFRNGTGATPTGITVVQLTSDLKFTKTVRAARLTRKSSKPLNFKLGIVSGYHLRGSTYHSEYFYAEIFERDCPQGGICALGYKWPQENDNTTTARTTDFLDWYDKKSRKYYFVGVLNRHYHRQVASYFKVKDMLKWLQENKIVFQ